MMMLPSMWGERLFDDWPFEHDFFGGRNPLYGKHEKNLMKTDVQDKQDAFEVAVDVPGFKKEDLSIQLENGYLTITANKSLNKETKQDGEHYIRKERYEGSCARTFYVGEQITEKDIHARLEDGILHLTIPKVEAKQIEQSKYIQID